MSNKRLAYYRWEWPDSIHKNLWTACTVSVYQPSYDMPFVSVLISIANGGGRVLMRTSSVAEAARRTGMPIEAMERLQLAETRAMGLLDDIKNNLRIIDNAHSLQPGSNLIRTDTGEIVAEAEKIIKDAQE